MAINERIIKNRKFRKCIDVANKAWMRISFWTAASDVEFDDGKTAEEKVTNLTANGVIKYLKIVDSLPNDAAQHPDTFYLVK